MFPKIGVPQIGWFIMENPIKMDDLGVPPFWKHPHFPVVRCDVLFARTGDDLSTGGGLAHHSRAGV